MKNIFKQAFFYCVIGLFSLEASAQQDAQASMYAFNPLHFNPAYAGSRGNLNAVGVFRSQWVGIKGAPTTQFLSVHSPIPVNNMALGLNLTNDKIGARNRTSFFANYAYTLRFKNNSKLNFGISGGGDMMSLEYGKVLADDPTEVEYLKTFAKTTFNVGSGIYYHADRYYIGLSSPRLLETKLKANSVTLSDAYTKRHFFLAGGYVHPINTILDLKTSILLKVTPNAPMSADFNANLFLNKKWWFGAMYRYNESIGVNLAYQIKESFMFGYAYDFQINGLSRVSKMGTHEVMLSYDLNSKNKAYGSPRYF